MTYLNKLIRLNNKDCFVYHRPDIKKIIILNVYGDYTNAKASGFRQTIEKVNRMQFANFVFGRYEDVARMFLDIHKVAKGKENEANSRGGSSSVENDVLTKLNEFFLSREECLQLFSDIVNIWNASSTSLFDVVDRSYSISVSEDAGGLLCLYGGSGSGKTTFIADLVEKAKTQDVSVPVILTSEPTASSIPLNRGISMLLAHMIVLTEERCIAFDSFRGIVYGSGGSTLSGGVSAAMLEITMNLSRLASLCGKLLLGVINPLNVDEEKNKTLIEALLGSTTGVVKFSHDTPDRVELNHRFQVIRAFHVVEVARWSGLRVH